MKTIIIILAILVIGYVVLQTTGSQTAKNTGTAVKEAGREIVDKTKEGVNELKEKVDEQNIPEKAEKSGEKLDQMALDASITAAIKMKLANDETVKALNINVETDAGHVTLIGKVSSTSEADRAIELAKQVDGVKSVKSQLTVQ